MRVNHLHVPAISIKNNRTSIFLYDGTRMRRILTSHQQGNLTAFKIFYGAAISLIRPRGSVSHQQNGLPERRLTWFLSHMIVYHDPLKGRVCRKQSQGDSTVYLLSILFGGRHSDIPQHSHFRVLYRHGHEPHSGQHHHFSQRKWCRR